MAQVVWTRKSISNLQAIFNYISVDSPVFAGRFVRNLISCTDRLEALPESGRIVPEFENPAIREIIYKNYRIVYRIGSVNLLEIVAVVHASRDMRWHC